MKSSANENDRPLLVARARRRKHQSGAAMVEYAAVLFAVLICAAGAVKVIGPAVRCAGQNATGGLDGGSSGACSGATASASSGGGSGAGGSAAGGSRGAAALAGSGSAADESTGSGSGGNGYVASNTAYDDGAGGLISGSSTRIATGSGTASSGSSSDSAGFAGAQASGSGLALASFTSGGGSGSGGSSAAARMGFASLASVGGGGGGGGGGSVGANSGSGSAGGGGGGGGGGAAGEESFSAQVAGTSPQKIDLTLAKLSSDVYGDKNAQNQKGADGFKPLTKDQLAAAGITPNMLQDKKSGFVADVYTNGKGDYVVAYRGTMLNTWTGWANDGLQGAGLPSPQYNEGARLAAAAKNAYGNNVVFTGHSLGGGLADSAAAATGNTAVTFNAAGLSDHTMIAQDGVNPAAERAQANNGQMRSYEVKGEALSTLQDAKGSILPKALGRQIQIADPDPALTAADHKKSSIFNPGPTFERAGELHGEYLQGLKAGPVKYVGANGKIDEYSFYPPHS